MWTFWQAGYQARALKVYFAILPPGWRRSPGVRGVSYSDRGLFSGFDHRLQCRWKALCIAMKPTLDRLETPSDLGIFRRLGFRCCPDERSVHRMRRPLRGFVSSTKHLRSDSADRNPLGKHVTSLQRSLVVIGVAKDIRVQSLRSAIDPKLLHSGHWLMVRGAHVGWGQYNAAHSAEGHSVGG